MRLRRLLIFLFFNFAFSLSGISSDSIPVIKDTLHIYSSLSGPSLTADSVTSNIADTGNFFIAGIALYGNKKTKAFIIEREIPFKEGDYIRKTHLEELLIQAKEQVINTGLFAEAIISVENKLGELLFISVTVREKWYVFPLPYFKLIDRNFNEWYVTHNASLNRVNYGVKLQHNNFSGRNDKMQAWFITGYSRQIAFKYERPYIDDALKNGFNFYINYTSQKEINFKSDSLTSKQQFITLPDHFVKQSFRISGDYVYRPAIKTYHIFRIAYVQEHVADTVIKANPNYFSRHITDISFPEVSYTLRYFNTDFRAYPTRGFQGEAMLLKRGFTRTMNMYQLQVIGSQTFPFSERSQVQLQAGGMLKVSFNQPYYNKQLFGYGGIFLQGLEYYIIDGLAGGVGRITARTRAVSFTLRNPPQVNRQVILPVRIFIKTFGNLGYTHNEGEGITAINNRWLHTYGFGADVIVNYDIVFKFDYSFNQFHESGFFFHVRKDF